MEIDGPTFVPKVAIFFLIWVKVCLKKLAFSSFCPILEGSFLDKVLALSNKKSTLVLVYGFLTVALSQFCPNIVEKSLFHQKRYLKLSLSPYLMLNYTNL